MWSALTGARWRLTVLTILIAISPIFNAAASDPNVSLRGLRHTGWMLGDGAPGKIRAIAQGRDGFLWLGTSTGLYRFDGITFERIAPEDDGRKRSLQITALLAARNGDIWVGYDYGGIGVLRNGRLRDANPWKSDGGVDSIVQARDGSIWVTADSRGELLLSRLKNGRWTRIGARQGYTPRSMGPILAASDGSIYVAPSPTVLRMKPGEDRFEQLPIKSGSYGTLSEDPSAAVWLADDNGLRRLDGVGKPIPVTGANTPYVRRNMRFDRDGSLWIVAQDDGLTRLRPGADGLRPAERMMGREGLTSSLSLAVAEDREGNIWVGTESGLDRFSPSNIAQPRVTEGIVTGFVGPQGADRIFVAGLSGIYRIDAGSTEPALIFPETSIGVLCGNRQRLLTFSLSGHYLLTLNDGGRLVRSVTVGDPLSLTCALDADGTFWTGRDRLYRLVGTHLEPARGPAGEKTGTIAKLRVDGRGGLVLSRPSTGFRRYLGTTEMKMWSKDEQTIGSISSFLFTRDSLLVGAEGGLGRWHGKRFSSLRVKDYPFLADITGILQTRDGSSWLIGVTGIVRMKTAALTAAFDRPGLPISIERFGFYEGFTSRSYMNESNDIAQDASGRLWFATNKGLAYIDPQRIVRNALPPPVMIRSMTAAGRPWIIGSKTIELPVGTDRVDIAYTALSLTDAKANRFRYMLEGADTGWTDAQDRRDALYSNLGPGTYRFRVIAANNDGIWNRDGAVLSFRIAPHFYQTIWFVMLCVAAALGALWLLYRRRLQIVAEKARASLEAQLSERERIARELHDTLLQGFQGLVLRFQSVVEQLPPGDRARDTLESALDRADDVLIEGRERVRALRETLEPVALAARLHMLASRLVPTEIDWHVDEDGPSRLVCSPAADEITAIVAEAVTNAVRHSGTGRIDIHVGYEADKLTVTVRDFGAAIPGGVLEAGRRDGHYGLVGMRERAERLGGTMAIISAPGNGTEIRLTIAGRIAYP